MNKSLNKFYRWFRLTVKNRWLIFLASLLSVSLFILFLQPDSLIGSSSKSIFIVGLVNLNILLLISLVFVVARNIIKIIFDRKNKILGSKLRQRLVFAFVGLTIIPVSIMFFLASGLVNKAAGGWFSTQVEAIVDNAIEISKLHVDKQKDIVDETSVEVRNLIENNPYIFDNEDSINKFFSGLRKKYNLFSISIYSENSEKLYSSAKAISTISDFSEPEIHEERIFETLENNGSVYFEKKNASQFIRSFKIIDIADKKNVLVVTMLLNQELTAKLDAINASYKEYGQLKFYKNPLKKSYLFTLALITGVLLFSAIWFGFYLAREISVPLKRLSEATKSVAKGNYAMELKDSGDDEISEVARSFNQMVIDIKESRLQLDERRAYTETILNTLAVGVVGLNPELKVTTLNESVMSIFNVEDTSIGSSIYDLFDNIGLSELKDFITDAIYNNLSGLEHKDGIVEKEVNITIEDKERKIIVTIGKVEREGSLIGVVLVFDDITDLAHAQQMSAWREVARRIAHEIKNPLTPVKLTAQRLNKNAETIDAESLRKSAEVIVENVDLIKVLIDEFSKFARLPMANFAKEDLSKLTMSTIEGFLEENENIVFQIINDSKIPSIEIDKDQIKRCIINLLENAIVAVNESNISDGKIIIRTTLLEDSFVEIEISNNGNNISEEDKAKIFEPYYTTRGEGTGLGLAIVDTIVSEHAGTVKVVDNEPQGCKFIIKLPITHSEGTKRKLGV